MTGMEQIAGKSAHLLEDRGFVCYEGGFFLPPSREKEMLFVTARTEYAAPPCSQGLLHNAG